MPLQSVGNRSAVVRHWRLPSVKQLRTAADVGALPDNPVLLKMLLAEAVLRENGAEALLVYGDKLQQNAADVHALPDDPALLKLLMIDPVCRGRRMTGHALGHLEAARHYVGDGTGLFVHVSGKGRVSFGQRLRVAGSGRRVERDGRS